ncbi:YtxH domain-containing protein [Pseudodesulfovibrio sp. F-1]|uniref:YtxH domain-containing protein n=1 Tax=Pseudodesulfovibrio alkaliphilus TaxID=2661613 RepID=A0A7K1KKP7_9BACT|nr:YtxH domain-containing protein [Pseudodesulfovibrio alkaliphilus]MUM76648.1 YtxH domain-containing protein [Pseudodesulfovibrio alkaliphilus]
MSDHSTQWPQPGASSAEGAYSRDPQNPTHYFQDANQFGAAMQSVPASRPAVAQAPSPVASWFAFTNADYLKGLALGVGAALVVTNPTVQKAVVSGAVKAWAAIQGGVEELKEQVQDAKAELSQKD